MMNKEKIVKKLEQRKEKLREKGIRKIGLFGSFLKGTQKRGSDIDFLITLDKNTLDRHFEAQVLLEKIFKKKIDLVIEKSLRKELSYVKREAVYVTI